MADASNYIKAGILNHLLRGVALATPTNTYVALHTAAPSDATGGNEVTTIAWPSYIRKQAENGAAIGTGWSNPTDDGADAYQSKNMNALPFPTQNGAAPVIVTHFSVWDAATAGNLLAAHALATPVQIDPGETFVFDVNALAIKQT